MYVVIFELQLSVFSLTSLSSQYFQSWFLGGELSGRFGAGLITDQMLFQFQTNSVIALFVHCNSEILKTQG